MSKRIRVLVADDHAMVREALCAVIDSCSDMEVVGQAADGIEAVDRSCALSPDVIVMDLAMPRKDGVEATRELRRRLPEARILALTSFARDKKALLAIDAGAQGYLLKDSSCDVLIEAIREVRQGRMFLQHESALQLARELNERSQRRTEDLTDRELEVLKLVAQGLSNHEIAERLIISEITVAGHIGNILSKLHLSNRTQAALYALREGMIDGQ